MIVAPLPGAWRGELAARVRGVMYRLDPAERVLIVACVVLAVAGIVLERFV